MGRIAQGSTARAPRRLEVPRFSARCDRPLVARHAAQSGSNSNEPAVSQILVAGAQRLDARLRAVLRSSRSTAAKTAISRTTSTSPREIEYPDVEEPSLGEVQNTLPPLTLKNTENYEIWDLSLSEVVQITLCNSQVMRQLGGRLLRPRRKRFRARSSARSP